MNNKTNARTPLAEDVSVWLRSLALSVILMAWVANASSFELGHSRVMSAPGAPLSVQVPITGLSPADAASLTVTLAPAAVWQAAGLTPPVPLESISISIGSGRQESSRIVQLRSTEATQATVVDILLAVSTSASSRTAQASIIVPPPPKVRLVTDRVTVLRGDTLIGIAEQFPVEGANLYQQLWALYSSNPEAFLRENMNLLKAGASLRIPDADAVRAVDPAFAKAQYLAHVRAFRQGRGASQGNEGIPGQAAAQTLQTPPQQQQGAVEQAGTVAPAPANDQVRLTAAGQDAQSAQADTEVARAKALAEELERKQSLEQNITALQGAISSSGSTASSAENPGRSNVTGVTGQPLGQSTDQPPDSSTAPSTASSTAPSTASSTAKNGGDANNAALTSSASQVTESDAKAGSSTGANGVTSASSQGAQQGNEATNFFSKVGQWVSDNTTAAIALLLALIALFLAWALRSTKTKPSHPDTAKNRASDASAAFAQRLKNIDLSLDEKPEPSLPKPDNKG